MIVNNTTKPRPRYETDQNRNNEQTIVDYIKSHLGKGIDISQNLGYKYIIDRAILENGIVKGWVEIKYPNYDLNIATLPSFFISLKKIKSGLELSNKSRSPFFIVARFTKQFLFTEITNYCLKDYGIKWGGRTHTIRDKWDRELMFHIPVGEFHSIKYLKDRL